jgi:hypothetical protein
MIMGQKLEDNNIEGEGENETRIEDNSSSRSGRRLNTKGRKRQKMKGPKIR